MRSISIGRSTGRHYRVDPDAWTPRLVLILIALIWPTQLLTTIGILGANATASVAQHFHTTQVVWFSLIVTLISTLLTPFVIKLGDLHGKKKVMLGITVLGILGDLIALAATSFPMLLVGRAIAACYGPLPALSFPAVRDIFPARLVKTASGILGSTLGLVALASPFLAGFLIDSWGYRGALSFMVGSTAVSLVLILVVLPETPRHAFDEGFDWLGGIVLGGGLAMISFALNESQSWGWTSSKMVTWIVIGLLAIVVFYFVERNSPNPIINLDVLGRRPVAASLVSGALGQAVAYTAPTIAIMLALYPKIPGVSDGLGWTATHNAWVGVIPNLLLFVVGFIAARWLASGDPVRIWQIGLALLGGGYFLAGLCHSNEFHVIWTMSVVCFGGGLVVAASPVLVVNVVSIDEQGLGSGMLNMLMSMFSVLFSAVTFAALNSHSVVMKGTAFYLDAGFRWAFWCGVVFVGISLLVSLLIPKGMSQQGPVSDLGQVSDLGPVVHH